MNPNTGETTVQPGQGKPSQTGQSSSNVKGNLPSNTKRGASSDPQPQVDPSEPSRQPDIDELHNAEGESGDE